LASEFVVISADDPGAIRVTAQLDRDKQNIVTFGFTDDASFRIDAFENGLESQFELLYQGKRYAGTLAMPGKHNVLNAVGVIAVLATMGFPIEDAIHAVS